MLNYKPLNAPTQTGVTSLSGFLTMYGNIKVTQCHVNCKHLQCCQTRIDRICCVAQSVFIILSQCNGYMNPALLFHLHNSHIFIVIFIPFSIKGSLGVTQKGYHIVVSCNSLYSCSTYKNNSQATNLSCISSICDVVIDII